MLGIVKSIDFTQMKDRSDVEFKALIDLSSFDWLTLRFELSEPIKESFRYPSFKGPN